MAQTKSSATFGGAKKVNTTSKVNKQLSVTNIPAKQPIKKQYIPEAAETTNSIVPLSQSMNQVRKSQSVQKSRPLNASISGNNNNLAKRNNYFQSHIESLVGSENVVYNNKVA